MADIITVTGRAFKEGSEYWVFSDNKIYIVDPRLTMVDGTFIYWSCMPVGERNASGFKLLQSMYDAALERTTKEITVKLAL